MKKLSRILLAGLVSLAFVGEALAQAQAPTPPVAAPSGPAVSSEKPAPARTKRKAKRVRKHRRGKRAAKTATPAKSQ